MGPQQATHYLGLASSFHDPAVALVDSAGCVLFAEATERLETKLDRPVKIRPKGKGLVVEIELEDLAQAAEIARRLK